MSKPTADAGLAGSAGGMCSLRIVSGGQTGADRAALDAALALGVPCGGWCPEGRQAEDGPIAPVYPVTVLPGAGYRQRTRQNVLDSDGTVVMAFGSPTGGSKVTADFAAKTGKPCLVIDADLTTPGEAAVLIAVFLLRHRIHHLNVAGPRASGQRMIYQFVLEVMMRLVAPRKQKRRRASSA
jgi:hypothetical protein